MSKKSTLFVVIVSVAIFLLAGVSYYFEVSSIKGVASLQVGDCLGVEKVLFKEQIDPENLPVIYKITHKKVVEDKVYFLIKEGSYYVLDEKEITKRYYKVDCEDGFILDFLKE